MKVDDTEALDNAIEMLNEFKLMQKYTIAVQVFILIVLMFLVSRVIM